MNQRHIVTIALLWIGVLVVLSRSWLGDAKNFVFQATGKTTS